MSGVTAAAVPLTLSQRGCLRLAMRQGAAFPVPIQSRKGGSYARMVDRLVARGLLSKYAPHHILPAGRAALAQVEF